MKPRDPETLSHGPAASKVPADSPIAPGMRVRETVSNYPPVSQWDDVVMYDAKAHPRKVGRHYMLVPTTCFNCESAAASLHMWTKRRWKSTRSRAIPRTRARGVATAQRARRRSTRPATRSASCTRSSGSAHGAAHSSSRCPGMTPSTRSARAFARPSWKAGARRSCTTWAATGRTASSSGSCSPGESTASIRTPISAPRVPVWATPCGVGTTGRHRITPMPRSSSCSPVIWKLVTISTRTPSASWTPRCVAAPSWLSSIRDCRTPRRMPMSGSRRGPAVRRRCCSPLPRTSCAPTGRLGVRQRWVNWRVYLQNMHPEQMRMISKPSSRR
jgi:hypothetical protein